MKLSIMMGCVAVLAAAHMAQARPVSYPQGWTLMQTNDQDANNLHVHYSPTARYSIGYRAEYRQKENWQFHGAQLNYLAKRWNAPASQANVYVKNAVGVAYSDDRSFNNETQLAAFTGIALDWEDRRWFASYENRAYYAGDIEGFFTQEARVGVAPYLGDYGDLHTWLMLRLDHRPADDDAFTVTPLVRLFKGDSLAEAGISDQGDILLNWIVRF